MTQAHSAEGAHIRCHACGARPFASEWGLAPGLETFNLIKVGDLWGCAKHRLPAPAAAVTPRRRRAADASEQVEDLLGKLTRLVERMRGEIVNGKVTVDEDQREDALALIGRLETAFDQSRNSAGA
jgi:hypothetical protein